MLLNKRIKWPWVARLGFCLKLRTNGAPRGLGDLGRKAIYFRGACSTGNYFRGAGEQAHNFGDLGSPAKK